MTEHSPELTHDELALMAAFEAHRDDTANARTEIPDGLRGELEDYLALCQRVDALPLEPVSPTVRSAIMNAAVQQVQASDKASHPLATLLTWLMRPGPVLMGATAFALVAAVVMRNAPHEDLAMAAAPIAAADADMKDNGAMVAMDTPAKTQQPGAGGQVAAQDRPAAAPQQREPPRRMFAAKPASLGPAQEQALEAAELQGASDLLQAKRSGSPARRPPVDRPRRRKQAPTLDRLTAKVKPEPSTNSVANSASGGKRVGLKSPPKMARREFAAPPPAVAERKADQEQFDLQPEAMRANTQTSLSKQAKQAPKLRSMRQEKALKLAANTYYKGRDQAPMAPRAAPRPGKSAAQGAQDTKERTYQIAEAAAAVNDEDNDRKTAKKMAPRQQTKGTLNSLRAKFHSAKDHGERSKLLAQILTIARRNGDKKTESWALGRLKQLKSAQLTRSKSQAGKTKAGSKSAKTPKHNVPTLTKAPRKTKKAPAAAK